eukprot:TRINITY_DN13700_c0_g1_i1.p1 TRINITY_DN13700_c0_g1~~TRINITY_DN13700_c0_g1_i1.p1  ORF type:complete len:176 (-),score=51.09 TRINITY_DN13700_c0_g1_i1:155-682(-)
MRVTLALLTVCLNLNVIRSSPAPVPVGPSLNSNAAVAALAGIAVAAKIAEDECDDVGIRDDLCAVLYDEEKCKRSEDYLELRSGDQGVLPLLTTGLRRNDVESLIVRYRCKLELWDDDGGLESGAQPDLVIDRTSRTNLGRNKYVDSLADKDEYEHMNEKISAYRCTCRESTFGR